jgi:hypothetical protein
MPESVSEAFAAYLTGTDRDGLAPALRAAGFVGLAKLLDADPGARFSRLGGAWPSMWDGRRCALGAAPPADADVWSLWFDPAEVAVMTLLPRRAGDLAARSAAGAERRSATVGWLSLLRAGRWQVSGWAKATGQAIRLEPGGQLEPATGVTAEQARNYAHYFGKVLAGPAAWSTVSEVGDPLESALWLSNAGPELIEGVDHEDRALVQDRAAALHGRSDGVAGAVDVSADRPGSSWVDPHQRLDRVGFRTARP